MSDRSESLGRREFVQGSVSAVALAALPAAVLATDASADKAAVLAQIPKMHAANIKRLQEWIALPSIAAENRNYPQGPEHMAQLARDAGFTGVKLMPTSGKPGVFGRLDAGATHHDRDLLHVRRQAVRARGVELAAARSEARAEGGPRHGLHGARRRQSEGTGELVPERADGLQGRGQEAAGEPGAGVRGRGGDRLAALRRGGHEPGGAGRAEEVRRRCSCPRPARTATAACEVILGAKGVVELELVSSGEKWGRGPKHDVHSSLEARSTRRPGTWCRRSTRSSRTTATRPAVEGFFEKAKPLSAAQKKMIEEHAAEDQPRQRLKKNLGVQHWVHDASWVESLMLLESQPTINIEGLVAGYTGPGRQDRAAAPRGGQDRHAPGARHDRRRHARETEGAPGQARLRRHRGQHDRRLRPDQTDKDSRLIQTQLATYRKLGADPQLWPRSAGSWPGYLFTNAPLNLPAGHFGLGHGTGAHAPDEYYLIESTNPKVQGLDGAVASFVEYLYALA